MITRGTSGTRPRASPACAYRWTATPGRHVEKIEEAKGFAATLRGAVDAGTYPPPSVSPEPIAVVTFAVAADRFWKTVPIKRGKNQGKPRGTNEAQMIGKLCAWTPPARLGARPALPRRRDRGRARGVHGAPARAGPRGLDRQQLHPVDQGDRPMAGAEGLSSAPAVSGEADGLRRGKATKRHRRLVPDTIDEHGKVTQEGEERRLLKAATPWLQRLIIGGDRNGLPPRRVARPDVGRRGSHARRADRDRATRTRPARGARFRSRHGCGPCSTC